MSNVKRISLEELKEIANRVRAAGGGNPIDALMPSVPEDNTACLIARNLNFNCQVDGATPEEKRGNPELVEGVYAGYFDPWVMRISDKETALNISIDLGWPMSPTAQLSGYGDDVRLAWFLWLPPEVGQVAADFDTVGDNLSRIACEVDDYGGSLKALLLEEDQGLRKLIVEMVPYIEEAVIEAHTLASIIHPDGSISI